MHLLNSSDPASKGRYVMRTLLCIGFVALVLLIWGGSIEAVTFRLLTLGSLEGQAALATWTGRLRLLADLGLVLLVPISLAIAAAGWFQWRLLGIARDERAIARLDLHTGLLSRQAFIRAVRYGVSPDHDSEKTFGLLAVLSIDRFTDIIAEHGIATADNVPLAVAEALGRMVPPETLVCRFGESSFALAVEGRPDDAALSRVTSLPERIREDLARSGKMAARVTLSLGACSAPRATSEMRLQSAIVLNAAAAADGGDRVAADHG